MNISDLDSKKYFDYQSFYLFQQSCYYKYKELLTKTDNEENMSRLQAILEPCGCAREKLEMPLEYDDRLMKS